MTVTLIRQFFLVLINILVNWLTYGICPQVIASETILN